MSPPVGPRFTPSPTTLAIESFLLLHVQCGHSRLIWDGSAPVLSLCTSCSNLAWEVSVKIIISSKVDSVFRNRSDISKWSKIRIISSNLNALIVRYNIILCPIKGGKCCQLNCALPSFERCILTWEMLKYENAHLRIDEIRYLDPVPASPRKWGMMLWLIRNFLRAWDWSSVLPALVPPLRVYHSLFR